MKMDKYCLKCDTIYETNGIFCPKCGTILKPSLVKAKKKAIRIENERLEELKIISFKNEIYDERKSPDINNLMIKYPRVKTDLTYRLKPITPDLLANEIENSFERYSDYCCNNCLNYALGYCLHNLWIVDTNALCKNFEFRKSLEEPIYDKRVQQLEFDKIVFDENKLFLQKKYSYQVIFSIFKQETKKVIKFFNKSNNISLLDKIKESDKKKLNLERKKSPFKDIDDLINRTNVTDPIGLLSLRILYELEQNTQVYILLQPPTWIRSKFHVERII